MAAYIGSLIDFGKVFISSSSSSPKKLLWIVVPTLASVFVFGLFASRKSKRLTGPISIDAKQPSKATRVSIDNFLSSDLVPKEIIQNILSLMSSEDLAKFGQVSRKFKNLVSDNEGLWLKLLQQRWPEEDYSSYPSNYLQTLYAKKAKMENARLGFTPGRFLLTVMQHCANFVGEQKEDSENVLKEDGWWQQRFIQEIKATDSGVSIVLGKDEEKEKVKGKGKEDAAETTALFWIEANGTRLGSMRFLEVSDARKKFVGNKMLQEKIDSPYTGGIVGYINFDFCHSEDQFSVVRDFVQTILYETRGVVARLDNGYFRPSVILKHVPLSELCSQDGMNDGDNFLDSDRDSEYMTTLIQSIRSLLVHNNIANINVNYLNVTSNPLRCSDITPKMHELSLPVWIFDIAALSDKIMWNGVYYKTTTEQKL